MITTTLWNLPDDIILMSGSEKEINNMPRIVEELYSLSGITLAPKRNVELFVILILIEIDTQYQQNSKSIMKLFHNYHSFHLYNT